VRNEFSGSAGEVVQAQEIHGGVHFHPSPTPTPHLLLGELLDKQDKPATHRGSPRSLPAPSLQPDRYDSPKPVVVLRSGTYLPAQRTLAGRALSERAMKALGQVLYTAPLTESVSEWCATLGLPRPEPSRLAGQNNAHHLRLVSSAVADRHLVEIVAQAHLLSTLATPDTELLVTLDVSASLAPRVPDKRIPTGTSPTAATLHMLARAAPPAGALPRPGDCWPLRIGVAWLRRLIDALLVTLVDEQVVTTLTAIAETGPIAPLRPAGLVLRSSNRVRSLFEDEQLVTKPGAADSDGSDIEADPELEPRDTDQRHRQVEQWLVRITQDGGLSGMPDVLDRLPWQ
jgi:hypothetical protein